MRRMPVALGVTLAFAVTMLAGCGGGDDQKSSAPTASATPSKASTSASGSPKDENSKEPRVKTPRPKDPLAPGTIRPVMRDGKRPHPTVSAAPATLTGTVTYPDGVRLDITKATRGHVSGRMPGDLKGPTRTVSLVLKNDGGKTLDLSRVVVTLVYGKPGRFGQGVYTSKNIDFSGLIKSGKSAKAVYSFIVPKSAGSRITVHVDFDAVHTAAVFSGVQS